jgi:hypothetical protein
MGNAGMDSESLCPWCVVCLMNRLPQASLHCPPPLCQFSEYDHRNWDVTCPRARMSAAMITVSGLTLSTRHILILPSH